jgi:hypothetical protein
MDFKRLSVAAVIAWFVAAVYGITVQMTVMGDEFAKYPAVFRSEGAMSASLPSVFVGRLLAMFVLAYMYAIGYEGGSGVAEGIRFGLLLALFLLGFVSFGIYASFNIEPRTALLGSLVLFIQMIIVGAVIGATYKPSTRA